MSKSKQRPGPKPEQKNMAEAVSDFADHEKNRKRHELRRAIEEIKALRSQNRDMNLRLGVFDSMMSLFNANKSEVAGFKHDSVLEGLQDQLNELDGHINGFKAP